MSASKINSVIASVSKRLKFKLYDKEADRPAAKVHLRFCTRKFRTQTLGSETLHKLTEELPAKTYLRSHCGTKTQCVPSKTHLLQPSTDITRRPNKAKTFAVERNALFEKSLAGRSGTLRTEATLRKHPRLGNNLSPLEELAQHLNTLQRSNQHLLRKCSTDLSTVKTNITELKRTLGPAASNKYF